MSEAADEQILDWDDLDVLAEEAGTEESEDVQVPEEESAEQVEEPEEVSEEPLAASQEESQKTSESSDQAIDVASLPDDTKLKVIVDGEPVEISLKEYKNGISGEKAIAKRFSEYDRKEKQFKKQLDEINDYVTDLGETMRSQSVLEGVYKIGELNKIAPHTLKEALMKELAPEIERVYSLSEEQRRLEREKAELEYKKKQFESESKRTSAEQARKELEQSIVAAREAHDISEDEWQQSFELLDKNLPKDEEITVKLVAKNVLFNRANKKAGAVLSEFEEGKFVEDKSVRQALQEIVLESPDMSNQELMELLAETYAEEKKKTAQSNLEKAASGKKAGLKTQTNTQNEEEELILDWEDLK